ncbi:MAG: hypothetical protein ACK56I_35730, partial [bacterium]
LHPVAAVAEHAAELRIRRGSRGHVGVLRGGAAAEEGGRLHAVVFIEDERQAARAELRADGGPECRHVLALRAVEVGGLVAVPAVQRAERRVVGVLVVGEDRGAGARVFLEFGDLELV